MCIFCLFGCTDKKTFAHIEIDYSNTLQERIAQQDNIVCGNFVKKKNHLRYADYVFEITEVLKGDITQGEKISVRSTKPKGEWAKTSLDKIFEMHWGDIKSYQKNEEYLFFVTINEDERYEFQDVVYAPLSNPYESWSISTIWKDKLDLTEETTRDEFLEIIRNILTEYPSEPQEQS